VRESSAPRRRLWPAEVVYDGLGRPRKDAAVLVQEAPLPQRIIEVGGLAALREASPGVDEADMRRVIALPPVNAHTHLDLSDMPLSAGGYLDFVRAVMAHRRANPRSLAAAESGLAQLAAAGISVVGDIVTDTGVLEMLLKAPQLSGVAYWEVIAPRAADAERVFAEVRAIVERFRPLERPGGVRLGLSPHSPHTVSAPLLQRLARYALQERLPLQIHVAEDASELPFHATGTGPLFDFMEPHLDEVVPSGLTPIGVLASLGVLEARPTLVHAVHVDGSDVRALQRAGCAVVHCPRSNACLNTGTFPWALYARHGVSVALGTDSLGSAPSLSTVDEWAAACLVHGAAADAAQLVWAAVKGGYRALGLTPPRVVRGDAAEALMLWPDARPWP